jgi:hypothetical protein
MSDDCQKEIVKEQGVDWGEGKCDICETLINKLMGTILIEVTDKGMSIKIEGLNNMEVIGILTTYRDREIIRALNSNVERVSDGV